MRKSTVMMIFLLGISILVLSGCGSDRPKGMPKLYPATITVTYDDGSPAVDANVILFPENTAIIQWVYSGKTDQNGNAIMKTHGAYPGIPEGKYKVSLQKLLSEGLASPGTPNMDDPESIKKYEDWKKSNNKEKKYQCFEKKYTAFESSGLEVTIAKQNEPIKIKAGKSVKELLPSDKTGI